jgi:hypothetical protein
VFTGWLTFCHTCCTRICVKRCFSRALIEQHRRTRLERHLTCDGERIQRRDRYGPRETAFSSAFCFCPVGPGLTKPLHGRSFSQLRHCARLHIATMEARLPARLHAYDPYGRGDAEDGMDDEPRDPAYDGPSHSRWEDDLESSSRQGPNGQGGMGTSSSGFQTTVEDDESMTASEAAKLRSFRALRTAKACDVSSSFLPFFEYSRRRRRRRGMVLVIEMNMECYSVSYQRARNG